jgi:hypothetical protein
VAEATKAACPQCPRTDVSVVGGGVLRAHAANGKKITPENPACPGSGQAPRAETPGAVAGYVCRVPAGPAGCGHVVGLTSNGRARSHLDNSGKSCPGGSDWPLKVDADGSRTDTAPQAGPAATWLCGCDGVTWDSFGAMNDAGHGIGRCRDKVLEQPVAPAVAVPGPGFTAAIAEMAKAVGEPGTVRDRMGLAGVFERDADNPTITPRSAEPGLGPDPVECACNLQWTGAGAMRAAGHDDMDCDTAPMVRPAGPDEAGHGDMVFDVTHRHIDESGTEWVHPGDAGECRLPDCCAHPQGFVYGDDEKGHSGSVCPLCGGEEPGSGPADWRTPPDLLEQMPEHVRRLARGNPECWDCGHEVTPLADRFELDGSVKHVVWACRDNCENARAGHLSRPCRPQRPEQDRLLSLDEGDLFVRHTARPPLDKLVYRAGAPGMGPLSATVVTPGPYAGRTGTLTNLEEEITCTDADGRVRPRRDPGTGATSPSSPRSGPSPTPSHPARTEPPVSPFPGPGSTPATTESASAESPSTRATSSGPTDRASGKPPTAAAGRRTDVADAFSTPKQALREADKHDSYGRYKLVHPDTGKPVKWTRATTFAKSVQDTYALSMWSQRMTLKGAALRPDITAAVIALDVKADKDRVNGLVGDAKKAAGDKVAANKGTAVHAFTEDRDRRLVGLPVKDREVPEEFAATVDAYAEILGAFGLEPVPGLIEFTTAVKQYEVAGTSDRVYRVTRDITVQLGNRTVTLYAGEYVIGDVKGLALTERIPTPDGWTTMGAVQVGDTVFDAYGQPTRVTVKSRAKRIGTYTVRFDDGSSVTCDTEHIWWTSTGTRPGEPTAKSMQEVIATLRDARTGQAHHRVPVAGPLDLPEADLPIDPYLLGCWLGDGHRRGGQITKGRDLFEILEADGHVLGAEQTGKGDCATRTVQGLTALLREHGLQNDKHIPAVYLRASAAQRTALLRGLMDTDGSWNTARRAATFSTVDKALALQVEELLLSLGQRPNRATVQGRGFGKEVTSYPVSFTPVGLQPFRLPRKADQAAASTKPVTRSTRRVIVSVEPGPDVETACIGVDAPTHTYLAGDRMVPTHNTGADLSYGWQEICIQLALYAQGINTSGVWSWEHGTWGKPTLPDNPGVLLKVRTDVGLVPHLPVDREATGAPLATLYAVDLDAGWAAAVLCAQVRTWRKARKIATALEIADVAVDPDRLHPEPGDAPQRPVSRPVVISRPVTLEDRAKAVTSRAEASVVFQEAKAARVTVEELTRLTGIMQAKLESFVEKGA